MVNTNICQREQIAAYVDGELDHNARSGLEAHIEECSNCAAELRAQRLFMCELDAVLANSGDHPVPSDFAQVVAAHAQSDMSGVRTPSEHRIALRFCILLLLSSLTLLGVGAAQFIFSGGYAVVVKVLGLATFLAKLSYATASSATIIARVMSRGFIIDTPFVGAFLLLLGLAVLLLWRLLAGYHRTRATN